MTKKKAAAVKDAAPKHSTKAEAEEALNAATEAFDRACRQADSAARAQIKSAVALRDAGQAALVARELAAIANGVVKSYADEEASVNRTYTSSIAAARRQAKYRKMVALARWFPATQS